MPSGFGCVGDVLIAAVGWLVDGSLIPQGPVDHRPRGSDPYPPDSGPNGDLFPSRSGMSYF